MRDSLRVLHLRASNFVGGPERQILSYCSLQSHEIHQSIAVFVDEHEGSPFLDRARSQQVEVYALPTGSAPSVSSLVRHVRDHQIDVICSHGYKADIVGLLAARATHAKLVPFLRGWTAENAKVRLFERFDRASLTFADRIVCLSQTQGDALAAQGVSQNKIKLVRNACSEKGQAATSSRDLARQALAARYDINDDDIVIACAGRLSPEKGTRYFLEAAGAIAASVPRTRFLIFGDGALRESLQQKAAALNTADRIIFAGMDSDFPALLPGVDLLINPSLSEQAPNVVLEAMTARVPCVATAVGAVPEISGELGTMLLVPPANSNAIAIAAKKLLLDPPLAKRMAESAYTRVTEEYGVARQHKDLQNLFAEFREPDQRALQSSPIPLRPPSEQLPFISVVMPVRNEEACIAAVLDHILQQDYDATRFEILVCDGMSDDSTPQIVAEYQAKTAGRVRLVSNPARWSSAGRNCGVRESRGDIVVFIDGHCHIPSNSMLTNVAGIYRNTVADVICRPQPLSANAESAVPKAICMARASAIGHGRDSTIFSLTQRAYVAPDSSGAIYRRDVFDRVGLYDESFDACEDVELNVRCREAGMLAYTSPGVLVEYEPRRTLTGLWKQMVRYGRGRARLYRKHPKAFSLAALAPALFIVVLVAALVLSAVSPYWLGFAAVLLAAYGIAIGLGSLPAALKAGPKVGMLTALSFICIHFGLGFGFLRETFTTPKVPATARRTSVT